MFQFLNFSLLKSIVSFSIIYHHPKFFDLCQYKRKKERKKEEEEKENCGENLICL